MPTALDRLLARPSALRALRALVRTPQLPRAWLPSSHCYRTAARRRQYSSSPNGPPAHKHQEPATGPFSEHETAVWVEVLLHKDRLHGLQGVREVWSHMRDRSVKMPVDDTAEAKMLWGTFVKHPELFTKLLDHAVALRAETGQVYPRLYETFMGYWLPRAPRRAFDYHRQLVSKLQLSNLPLRHLAAMAPSLHPTSLSGFMYIYRNSKERDIYDLVVPPLIDQGRIDVARQWHFLCTYRQDLPSPSVASHPVVQLFTVDRATSLAANMRLTSSADPLTDVKHLKFFSRRDASNPKYNARLVNRLRGNDLESVRFDDAFCARLFATRAFPPATIINGLAMVGVNQIGPQALRVLASRTEPIEHLPERFAELKEAGISLQACVFSLALEKFTQEKDFFLVRGILNSDQHHDVFDDTELQRKLLHYHLEREDWPQVHRTLAILTLFHNDSSTEAWNVLLQAHIAVFNPDHVLRTIQSMRAMKVMVSTESCLVLKRSWLQGRMRGHKPSDSSSDRLRLVCRFLMIILEGGLNPIPPLFWREIIRRYGMTGRIRELRRIVFWLLNWYAPRDAPEFSHLETPASLDAANALLAQHHVEPNHYFNLPGTLPQHHDMHPIKQLFPKVFQHALIIWGFRAGLLPNAPLEGSLHSGAGYKVVYSRRLRKDSREHPHWSIGLRTLVELRDRGLYVHVHTVVQALQMVFINLFNHRGISNRKENRVMQKENRQQYEDYVKEVNEIWGGDSKLFADEDARRRSVLSFHSWTPWARRKRGQGHVWRHIPKIVGPTWMKDHPEVFEDMGVRKHLTWMGSRPVEENSDHDFDASYTDPEWTFDAMDRANRAQAIQRIPFTPKKRYTREYAIDSESTQVPPKGKAPTANREANSNLDLLMRVSQAHSVESWISPKKKKKGRGREPEPIDPVEWAENSEPRRSEPKQAPEPDAHSSNPNLDLLMRVSQAHSVESWTASPKKKGIWRNPDPIDPVEWVVQVEKERSELERSEPGQSAHEYAAPRPNPHIRMRNKEEQEDEAGDGTRQQSDISELEKLMAASEVQSRSRGMELGESMEMGKSGGEGNRVGDGVEEGSASDLEKLLKEAEISRERK
ncbi:hypothetical protein P154DRAFT_519587 [Amniculicola lignicola CBS 123094]|uniref:Uncharacterized protein n=1 Tax=Amniculicola lignicola CBS 123094 TaxID=1392246 RepID=A0A6A5X1E7_9PLEO|nr:hypothetical protein P154DRAFT_519587 [Amniculicola lignicola CBS 123094]